MLLPVTCSCLTMTWAMAVTCSTPAKPGSLLKKKERPALFLANDPVVNCYLPDKNPIRSSISSSVKLPTT